MQNNDDIHIRISKHLRKLRLANDYSSFKNFAFDHDIPQMHYWRLEKGKKNVTIDT
jgi:hypothetical protein